jgi:hypothetical protein
MSAGSPPRLGPRPIVAAVLTVAAAGLLVVGSFLPSAVVDHFSDGSRDQEMKVTSWTRTIDPAPEGTIAQYYSASHIPLYGIPLAVVAAALLAAAVVSLLAGRRSPSVARTAVIGAAAAAAAAAFMLAMDVQSTLSYEGADPGDTASNRTAYDPGLGFWLIAGGAVLALAAGILMLFRTRSTSSDVTPPQGFRAPAYPQGGAWPPGPTWQGYSQQPPAPQGFPPPGTYPQQPPQPPQPGAWPSSQPPSQSGAWPPSQPFPQQPAQPEAQPSSDPHAQRPPSEPSP